MYAPTLPGSSPCANSSLIPANVTTRNDFPPNNLPYVALAPWTTPDCVQAYFSTMRSDGVRGAIFYLPDNGTTLPPQSSDRVWAIGDGGNWQNANQYPVYAIPGMLGAYLMNQLVTYSGNISQVPNGNELSQMYNSHDAVRLYARMDVESSSGIPQLWVFLIIVLAILLALVLSTSVFMNLLQRRQRIVLQRRVAAGEIDLEALGIKRLNVPQDVLDKMPIYVYTSKDGPVSTTETSGTAPREVPFSQTTCPICLDDFVHGETHVRELPCNHIFHPECIDGFLRENSSLCPMCKKSALPHGYCPVRVTNLMVRRERILRRIREEAARSNRESGQPSTPFRAIQRRVRHLSMPAIPPPMVLRGVDDANRNTSTRPTVTEEVPPPEIAAQGTTARREWLRERFARRQAASYDAQVRLAHDAERARPLCKTTCHLHQSFLVLIIS